MKVFGCDPGEVHVGVSDWTDVACNWAVEWGHDQLADFVLDGGLSAYDRVIIEGFWLRPGQGALQQAGSTFPTVELIGIIHHVCRREEIPFTKVTPTDRKAARQRLVGYKKYQRRSYGHGDHALDAEAVVVAGMRWSVTQLPVLE